MDNDVPGIVTHESQLPTQFKPEEAKPNIKRAEAVIRVARDIEDWEALDTAIDAIMEFQSEALTWWDDNVVPKDQHLSDFPDRLSVAEAEKRLKYRKQRLSEWRTAHKNPE